MQVVIAPAVQFPLFLSLLLKSVLWAYARLQPSSYAKLATSCNLVHVLTSYNISFRLEPMQIVSSPLPSSSLWTYAAPLPSSPFLSFCCKSKLFNSKENCKSQIPDSLSCFSLWATRKRTNYTTALLPSQDPLQSSTAVNLVKLHASLLVVQDVQSTWPKVRKGNPPGSTNITSILFSDYISTTGSAITNVGKPHWQSSLQRP